MSPTSAIIESLDSIFDGLSIEFSISYLKASSIIFFALIESDSFIAIQIECSDEACVIIIILILLFQYSGLLINKPIVFLIKFAKFWSIRLLLLKSGFQLSNLSYIDFNILKNQAVLGNLKFYTTDETPATYVYDERTAGTVMSVSKFGSDYEWMDEYLNKLQDMEDENKLHENVKLPELKVDYPVVYNKGDYKLTDKYIHKFNNLDIELPKNASDISIKKSYYYLTKYAA